MSKPLQVYLDADDLERLETFARERGWTKSQTIRTAIRALTRRRSEDPVLEHSGDIDALPPDVAQPPRRIPRRGRSRFPRGCRAAHSSHHH
jgi:hypothetical protein